MCSSTIQNFLNQTFSCNGNTYTTVQLAEWVSYQSYSSPYYGDVPISLIIAQWGIESGWGGADMSVYNNPGNQYCTQGGSQCGQEPNGIPAFCCIVDGVKAYSALLINGYPHVAHAYADGGFGQPGMQSAAVALGQGYEGSQSLSDGYCGGPSTISQSSSRIWATSQYNDGNGPGSALYDTINANDCLSNLNYVQTTNPGLPGF